MPRGRRAQVQGLFRAPGLSTPTIVVQETTMFMTNAPWRTIRCAVAAILILAAGGAAANSGFDYTEWKESHPDDARACLSEAKAAISQELKDGAPFRKAELHGASVYAYCAHHRQASRDNVDAGQWVDSHPDDASACLSHAKSATLHRFGLNPTGHEPDLFYVTAYARCAQERKGKRTG